MVETIEFLDSTFHVHEKLNLIQLQDLGWTYEVMSYGIKLQNGEDTYVVTSWPIDSQGKVSNHVAERL